MTTSSGNNEGKIGNFDWIVEYEDMQPFFGPLYTKIIEPISSQNVLVIGCGTSQVSEKLSAAGFGYVLSVDNDRGIE